ncbi:MAG: hypothetical protein V5A46_05590 [Haloferacaceae archaeon]
MVETRTLIAVLPHYLAMLVLVVLAVGILRRALGGVTLVAEFAVVLAIVFLYPFAVRRLGYEPGAWS